MNALLGNHQHVGARPEQQDAFGFSDPANRRLVAHGGVLGVLVDGMGGMRHGAQSAQTAVRAFLDAYQRKRPSEPIPDALSRSLAEANAAVVAFARQAGVEGETGATLVAVALHRHNLYWISAGDSRAYLVRGRRLYRLTVDHTYGAELDGEAAAGRIDPHSAATHPEREAVTSFVGMSETPQADASRRALPLQPGDSALLCSDGLYRTLSDEEIAAGIDAQPQACCERLVQRAIARNTPGQDNVTVVAMAPGPPSRNFAFALRVSWIAIAAIDLLMLAAMASRLAWGAAQ